MKFLDKLGLALFSVITLILCVILVFTVLGWLEIGFLVAGINLAVTSIKNVTLVVSIILGLLAIKCIFFNSFERQEKGTDGILLENENGKLLVSRDTIENIASSVVKTFDTAETVMTRVDFGENNSVSIFITLFVNPDAVIKDLANKLQTDVKEAIKKSVDLDVKEVNIRIKNITAKKENVVKE